jgi:hypothetical protein
MLSIIRRSIAIALKANEMGEVMQDHLRYVAM